MTTNSYGIEILDKTHQLGDFDCGEPDLNEFLKRYALRNAKKGYARTFVAVEIGKREVLGFYSLSAGSIGFRSLAPELRKGLPKYPVPIARLGRMGVHLGLQGSGLGTLLLSDAMYRVVGSSSEIGIFTLVVDAKNEQVKGFYRRFGFIEFQDEPLSMFLPLKTIVDSLGGR